MKRTVLALAFATSILSFVFAGGDPNFVYEEGKIGLFMADDTEVSEDDGTWMAFSEGSGVLFMIEATEKVLAAKDMTEANLAAMCVEYGVDDFEQLSSMDFDGLTYIYGKGSMTDADDNYMEGFFGMAVNASVKKKSFFFAILVPSLEDEAAYGTASGIVENLTPVK